MAALEGRTPDGVELHLGSNHFAHFLLFQLLKGALLHSSTSGFASRVINVSSGGHKGASIQFDDQDSKKRGYDRFAAYCQSKTANIYMANSIERHYGSRGLRGLSVHPGAIWGTDITRHLTKEEIEPLRAMMHLSKSSEQGAATTVWAALSPHFNEKGGIYLADVGEAGPVTDGEHFVGPGYAPHAYDEEAEERLWKLSYYAVGLQDDD